jgi:L-iditol 2-dehydrogenase
VRFVGLETGPGGDLGAKLREAPVPRLRQGDLLVEMKACGLCGTDIEKMRGEYKAAMPVIGHEAVGVVAAKGKGVGGFEVGDRVFPHHHVSCGRCYYCRTGSETMCADYKTSNLDPGGFSELFRVPRWNVSRGGVLRLPRGVGFNEATMVEPVACCLRALGRSGVIEGESALVVGAGPVGMAHALLLRHMKAEVIVSDVSASRRAFARSSKVGTVLDPATEDVPEAVRSQTDGRGADLAMVASGSPRAVVQALKSVRRGGRVCLFGVPPSGAVLEYDLAGLYNQGVAFVSSYGATEAETTRALELVASRHVDFRGLITHVFRLRDFGKGVATASSGLGMKVVIVP